MGLIQLQYSSASGFTSVGPGASPWLLREAEPLLGYEPPPGAPQRPTTAELGAFPETFSHSLLADGSRLVARAVCTGGGSFQAQAVHLPLGTTLPDGALPITAFGARPGGLDLDRLIGFAASRASWLAGFFADLRQVIQDDAAPRIVVVERDSAAVARWIALAGTVLPREIAHRLTFTTYTRRPELARQQIIGVLPEDAHGLAGHGHRYRVYDCTGRASGAPTEDVWARIAAHVWLGRAPRLFEAVTVLSDGPLAVEALCAGLDLDAEGRTAAADWVRHHADTVDRDRLRRLVNALSAHGGSRTAAETAASTRLFPVLDARLAAVELVPFASLVLTDVVRSPGAGTDLDGLRRVPLTDDLRRSLAGELGPELRAGVADAGHGPARTAELLCVADILGVDCADLLAGVARRLAVALLADPDAAHAPAVRLTLEDRFDLRALLLAEWEVLAQGDPPAVARLLATVPMPFTASQVLPHLRMCAEAPRAAAADGGRVAVLNAVLRAGRVSPMADPTLLRTAVRLVWGDDRPTAGEARAMLGENGSSAHLAAGTWSHLVGAALHGPADDPDVPDLAHDLLRGFSDDLRPRERRVLQLLDFARELRNGSAAPEGWTDRVLTLRAAGAPVEPAVLERVYDALAYRLLTGERPDGELAALVNSGDVDLITAYGRAARSKRMADRLCTVPVRVADCFIAWSSYPQVNAVWEETRSHLLDSVLRPMVRTLSSAELAAVEERLKRADVRWAVAFQDLGRSGAWGRFGRRLTGRQSRR